jgi:hypothetical protein
MYKPQSLDTSEKVDRLQFARYREMSVDEKLSIVADLNAMVQRIAFEGMRRRHPDASDDEIWLRLAAVRLGRETVRKVYGWDPDDE